MLGIATVYAGSDFQVFLLRNLGMCLQYGRLRRLCGASKTCDVVCRKFVADADVQRSVGDAIP